MRALLLCVSLLMAVPIAAAEKGRSTAQGVNQQMATAQAMRGVPKGATVVDTTCKEFAVGAFTYRFQCTVHWAQ
jgi:cytochrome c5